MLEFIEADAFDHPTPAATALRPDDFKPNIVVSKREDVDELVAQPFDSVELIQQHCRDVALRMLHEVHW